MATKYIARWNGQIVGKRTTQGRTYTHAVVTQRDEAAARKRAYEYVATDGDRTTYDYYVERVQAGAAHPYFDYGTPETIARQLAEFAAKVAGGFEGFIAQRRAFEIERFERDLAKGLYQPRAVTWCGRLDLARKEAARRPNVLGITEAEIAYEKPAWIKNAGV